MLSQIETYLALFYIYSFAGWVMETVGISIREKKLVDRGFLIGPYCPIYGTGVVLITILLKKYSDDVLATFVMSIIICGILEYLTSYFMEKIFKARWWDYSDRKFNLNGRVCLQNLIVFGLLGTTIVFVINPFFIKYIEKVPELALHIILSLITILFIVDTIVSYKVIFDLKDMSKEFRDNTEEISEKVQKRIRSWKIKLYRRLVKAFPAIKEYVKYNTWEEIKKKIEESRKDFKERIENSKKEFNEKVENSRKEFNKKIENSKREFSEKMENSKKEFNEKIENSKREFSEKMKASKKVENKRNQNK